MKKKGDKGRKTAKLAIRPQTNRPVSAQGGQSGLTIYQTGVKRQNGKNLFEKMSVEIDHLLGRQRERGIPVIPK
jgi:hypothetical protein